ncbi:thiol reductant ABC exporter subunit CydC [Oricola thermophila]|uniref:Thiol reductant ABC exporter subunit CydC n=1 Tax=Oricola thermophila TaxID=2742145 RepID=A0A6N1V7X4_9HYPH|nr:thiol reductant ABC exporter subunit CydC [Oricola thermophila]QKV17021.1 thiol reductant ABC exporter subunit CydC [Oricola thermophila]
MKTLLPIIRRIWSHEWWALLRGTALAMLVLIAGIALLGLSGWFITAAGLAGVAGAGIAFDVFRPSAGVRFLALGRTAARYGERILTHDATLRSLARLRVQLLAALANTPFARLPALRASEQLNRLTRDVDALDGVALRLLIPIVSALTAVALTAAVLRFLVDPRVVTWLLSTYVPGSALALVFVAWRSRKPSRSGQLALNAFRMRFVDLLRARADLAVSGKLATRMEHVTAAEARMRAAVARTDRIERTGGIILSVTESAAAAGALLAGAMLAKTGSIDPARAALGFFAALALAEMLGPLRRGMAEIGRMTDAARRVNRLLATGENSADRIDEWPPTTRRDSPALVMRDVRFMHPGAEAPVLDRFELKIGAGEIVALVGPSGSGKSTILHLAARMLDPDEGQVEILGIAARKWSEPALREAVALLPQRSALLSGTIRDALALARPDIDDREAWSALTAVALDRAVQERGGVDSRLGESGAGLSGGERRRLALARVLLRRPSLLLLDEPTEGLDRETARNVLAGIRGYLPDATIVLASHRAAEREFADRVHYVAPAGSPAPPGN